MPIKFYLNSGVKKENTMIKLGVNFAMRWSFLRLKVFMRFIQHSRKQCHKKLADLGFSKEKWSQRSGYMYFAHRT